MKTLFISATKVITRTEELYNLKKGSILGWKRSAMFSEARAVAMYFVKHNTPMSFLDIADDFKKDHTTVIYNCKRIEKILLTTTNSMVSRAILILQDEFLESK